MLDVALCIISSLSFTLLLLDAIAPSTPIECDDVATTAAKTSVATLCLLSLIDLVLLRPVRVRRAREFLVHALTNFGVLVVIWGDFCFATESPHLLYSFRYTEGGVRSTAIIASYHLYHCIVGQPLSLEEWTHHVVSGLLVPWIALQNPFGCIIGWVNAAMMGFPGLLDYLLLAGTKYGLVSKGFEKRVNAQLQLVIRLPVMWTAGFLHFAFLSTADVSSTSATCMSLATVLHLTNAVYYTKKIVQNAKGY